MTKAKPAEQKRNGASDEDLKQINERLDGAAEERDEAIVNAKAKYKRQVKIIEAEAKQVGVLMTPLKQARKLLALQTKLTAETEKTKPDEIELVEDMVKVLGGFADTPLGSAAIAALDQRSEAQKAQEALEQVEGAEIAAKIAGGQVH